MKEERTNVNSSLRSQCAFGRKGCVYVCYTVYTKKKEERRNCRRQGDALGESAFPPNPYAGKSFTFHRHEKKGGGNLNLVTNCRVNIGGNACFPPNPLRITSARRSLGHVARMIVAPRYNKHIYFFPRLLGRERHSQSPKKHIGLSKLGSLLHTLGSLR